MNEPFSPEALEQLIYQISIAKSKQDPLCCPAGMWKSELLTYPERFRVENDELLYVGYPVGVYGNRSEIEEFQCLVDKIVKKEK